METTTPFKSVRISYSTDRRSETIIAKTVKAALDTLSEEQINELNYVSVDEVNVIM